MKQQSGSTNCTSRPVYWLSFAAFRRICGYCILTVYIKQLQYPAVHMPTLVLLTALLNTPVLIFIN